MTVNIDPTERLLDKLAQIPGYPLSRSKDLDFLFELIKEFQNGGRVDSLPSLAPGMSAHPNLRYRLFLRRWMQNAAARKAI